jgi:hypothetical protein
VVWDEKGTDESLVVWNSDCSLVVWNEKGTDETLLVGKIDDRTCNQQPNIDDLTLMTQD